MSKAIPKECMALLKEASEMFSYTGCVPGIDGEEVPAETIAGCEGIHLGDNRRPRSNLRSGDMGYVRVCAGPFVAGTKMESRCRKLTPLGSKDPEQFPTKEQQKACLEMAAAELIREITQGRSLN